ncbi:MAG: helix-turn-helix transcriptional regulator [Smithella sp.]
MSSDILKKQLGLRLKQLRLAKGLRQEDLEKWGFSYRYYGRLERGMVNPTIETLAKLCEIFDVALSDLFLFLDSDIETVSDEREAVLIRISQLMKENKRNKIKKLKVFLEEIL